MSLMMPVFKRSLTLGTVEHRHIGAEQWPEFQSKDWYDSPDKVPLNPGQMNEALAAAPVYNAPVKPYGAFGTVLGETPPVAPRTHKAVAAEQPRVNGRFVKASGGKRR